MKIEISQSRSETLSQRLSQDLVKRIILFRKFNFFFEQTDYDSFVDIVISKIDDFKVNGDFVGFLNKWPARFNFSGSLYLKIETLKNSLINDHSPAIRYKGITDFLVHSPLEDVERFIFQYNLIKSTMFSLSSRIAGNLNHDQVLDIVNYLEVINRGRFSEEFKPWSSNVIKETDSYYSLFKVTVNSVLAQLKLLICNENLGDTESSRLFNEVSNLLFIEFDGGLKLLIDHYYSFEDRSFHFPTNAHRLSTYSIEFESTIRDKRPLVMSVSGASMCPYALSGRKSIRQEDSGS